LADAEASSCFDKIIENIAKFLIQEAGGIIDAEFGDVIFFTEFVVEVPHLFIFFAVFFVNLPIFLDPVPLDKILGNLADKEDDPDDRISGKENDGDGGEADEVGENAIEIFDGSSGAPAEFFVDFRNEVASVFALEMLVI